MQKDNDSPFYEEWLEKARHDLRTADLLMEEEGLEDVACFHAHQVAEKSLKAYMVFMDIKSPKSHDLIHLLNTVDNNDLENLKEDILYLNHYYVESRYPFGQMIYSKEEAYEAILKAKKIMGEVIKKINS